VKADTRIEIPRAIRHPFRVDPLGKRWGGGEQHSTEHHANASHVRPPVLNA
jgi:hypothetical protein